ncbi:hypothetical protein SUGI_0723050 [Cryptomeria japonica]|nr:hypothetical protein SUGI_0723050 [Cryptomeria japonica]
MDYSFKENEIWRLPKNFSGLKVLKLKRSRGTDRSEEATRVDQEAPITTRVAYIQLTPLGRKQRIGRNL